MNTDKIYAEAIANEYAPKDNSKVVALKKLDRKAKLPAIIFGYNFGIFASLVAGTGMCFSMGELGDGKYMALGIVIGLIGFAGMGINYPIYKRILENGKQKYAYDIIELARQITDK